MALLTEAHQQQFAADGYAVVRGLFSPEEAARYRDHYTAMREEGPAPIDGPIANPAANDPLLRYPRLMQPHRWDEESLAWLLDARINACLTGLLGREPYAVQTMVYFKPPGARGQALHQDNYYLRVQPGTCVAAWMALDACDEANGCLQVVPGSHTWPILCTEKADTSQSFTDVVVPLPPGVNSAPVEMQAGDVLFFNGQLVHGSNPNTTPDRFRRSLIGHYIEGDSQKVAHWYFPALRMDGSPIELESSGKGTSCGVWVDRDGQTVAEVSGFEVVGKARE